jgi:hypothetical protein
MTLYRRVTRFRQAGRNWHSTTVGTMTGRAGYSTAGTDTIDLCTVTARRSNRRADWSVNNEKEIKETHEYSLCKYCTQYFGLRQGAGPAGTCAAFADLSLVLHHRTQ